MKKILKSILLEAVMQSLKVIGRVWTLFIIKYNKYKFYFYFYIREVVALIILMPSLICLLLLVAHLVVEWIEPAYASGKEEDIKKIIEGMTKEEKDKARQLRIQEMEIEMQMEKERDIINKMEQESNKNEEEVYDNKPLIEHIKIEFKNEHNRLNKDPEYIAEWDKVYNIVVDTYDFRGYTKEEKIASLNNILLLQDRGLYADYFWSQYSDCVLDAGFAEEDFFKDVHEQLDIRDAKMLEQALEIEEPLYKEYLRKQKQQEREQEFIRIQLANITGAEEVAIVTDTNINVQEHLQTEQVIQPKMKRIYKGGIYIELPEEEAILHEKKMMRRAKIYQKAYLHELHKPVYVNPEFYFYWARVSMSLAILIVWSACQRPY